MISTIDETELARLEELAKDATPTPWMGAIDPSHFYTFSTILGGEKKTITRLKSPVDCAGRRLGNRS